jgi:site-specific recombinase XerD
MPRLNEKPIIRLYPEEVSRLLAAVKPSERYYLRDLTILTFFLSTGVRVSELVGLDIKHINIENASFIVTRKGGKIETQYMTEDLQIQLLIYMDSIDTANENAPLFSSRDNPRIADNTIRLLLEKYIRLAGIKKKISPHKLRSTFGTNLYRKTRDIFAVAQCLGHSSVNTTRKYYAALDEDIKREAIKGFHIA